MKHLSIVLILTSLFLSCHNNGQEEKLKSEIQILKRSNDSLREITEKIKHKYVFDSISFRQIPHYSNTYKLNSINKEEFVFVGYNTGGKSSVIIGESIYEGNEMKISNGDTLKLKNGAFYHELKLTEEQNFYGGILKTENEFGKKYEVPFRTAIGTIKD